MKHIQRIIALTCLFIFYSFSNAHSLESISKDTNNFSIEELKKIINKKNAEIIQIEANTELKEQRFLAFIIIILMISIYVVINRFTLIKRHKQIIGWQVDWAEEQWAFAHEQKEILELQKNIIEEKQNQIIDSINYAKKIQTSLLLTEKKIHESYLDSFIFFQPKDIVSGDFYWFTETLENYIFVVVDCTGHGVPGGFLTMIGNTLLNEIITHKKIHDPASIIIELSIKLSSILNHENSLETISEGMDISICNLEKGTNEILYTGINQSIYISTRNGIERIQPQINSIFGIFDQTLKQNLVSKKIVLEPNSIIYLSSDGFMDQIGGTENKKMFHNGYQTILEKIRELPFENQKNYLENYFLEWKGKNVQFDDVLIVSFKT